MRSLSSPHRVNPTWTWFYLDLPDTQPDTDDFLCSFHHRVITRKWRQRKNIIWHWKILSWYYVSRKKDTKVYNLIDSFCNKIIGLVTLWFGLGFNHNKMWIPQSRLAEIELSFVFISTFLHMQNLQIESRVWSQVHFFVMKSHDPCRQSCVVHLVCLVMLCRSNSKQEIQYRAMHFK